MGDGNGTNAGGSSSITKFTKGGSSSAFTCSGGEHSGGTESW